MRQQVLNPPIPELTGYKRVIVYKGNYYASFTGIKIKTGMTARKIKQEQSYIGINAWGSKDKVQKIPKIDFSLAVFNSFNVGVFAMFETLHDAQKSRIKNENIVEITLKNVIKSDHFNGATYYYGTKIKSIKLID